MKRITRGLAVILFLSLCTVIMTTPVDLFADVDGPYEGGLLSLKGEKWQIGGELEIEYRNNDEGANRPDNEFRMDQFYLIPIIKLHQNVTLKAEVSIKSDKAIVEEAHATFSGFPGNTFVKIGLDDRFIKRSRITETYPLNGSAFWRDDDLGITLGGKFNPLYWFISYTNGLRAAKSTTSLTTKGAAEDDAAIFLHDDRNVEDNNSNKEVGIGLGLKHKLELLGEIDIFGWGFFGELDDDEVVALIANFGPAYSSTKNDRSMWGARLTHKLKTFQLVGEYIGANTGDIDRRGWYIEPSYKLATAWDRPKSFTFLFRYNELDNSLVKDTAKVLTWDWTTYTLAVITEIQKNIKLKVEYNIIDEEPSRIKEVKNNEVLVQLEIAF